MSELFEAIKNRVNEEYINEVSMKHWVETAKAVLPERQAKAEAAKKAADFIRTNMGSNQTMYIKPENYYTKKGTKRVKVTPEVYDAAAFLKDTTTNLEKLPSIKAEFVNPAIHAEKVSQLKVPEGNPNALEYIKQIINSNPKTKEGEKERRKVLSADPLRNLHYFDRISQENLIGDADKIVKAKELLDKEKEIENTIKDKTSTEEAGKEQENAIKQKSNYSEFVMKLIKRALEELVQDKTSTEEAGKEQESAISKTSKIDKSESMISMSNELIDSIIECCKEKNKFSTTKHLIIPTEEEDIDKQYENYKQNNINLFNNTINLLESIISLFEGIEDESPELSASKREYRQSPSVQNKINMNRAIVQSNLNTLAELKNHPDYQKYKDNDEVKTAIEKARLCRAERTEEADKLEKIVNTLNNSYKNKTGHGSTKLSRFLRGLGTKAKKAFVNFLNLFRKPDTNKNELVEELIHELYEANCSKEEIYSIVETLDSINELVLISK